MKNRLTSIFTFLCIIIALCSAFFGMPGDEEASLYDSMTIATEATVETAADVSEDPTELPATESPDLSSAATILEAAYELNSGESLEGTHTLTGVITAIVDRYSEKYDNITVMMEVSGCEDQPIQCFRMKGQDAEGISVGDTITVTGRITNYQGTVEFDAGCQLDRVDWLNPPVQTQQNPSGSTQSDHQDQQTQENEDRLLYTGPSVSDCDDSKEAVALYIYTYGCLPDFYVTKAEAERLYGWDGGALDKYAPGMCIGGDTFRNYDGQLPDAPGRKWTECDIDTIGSSKRGAKRIVFSNDGLIYYTDDHYDTFELLYGEP